MNRIVSFVCFLSIATCSVMALSGRSEQSSAATSERSQSIQFSLLAHTRENGIDTKSSYNRLYSRDRTKSCRGVACNAPTRKHNCPRCDTPRFPQNPLIPYIIAPRTTFILDPQPFLAWNRIPNVTRYTVQLLEISGETQTVIWDTETEATRVQYDGEPLRSGRVYLVAVQAPESNNSSGEEQVSGIGFQVLNPEDATYVRNMTASIAQLALAESDRALLLADLYTVNGLYAEAIAFLEDLTEESKTVRVYWQLGKLYEEIGLLLMAVQRYHVAARIAQPGTPLLAEVQSRLGQLYFDFNQKNKARQWWEAALGTYQTLDYRQQITEIKAKLNQL
jgi:hypothetical protein